MFSGSFIISNSISSWSCTRSPLSEKLPVTSVITAINTPDTAPATITDAIKNTTCVPVRLKPIFIPPYGTVYS